MFLIYFISYGCNGGALVFLGGAEASASPSFALPMFITIKKIIILHLFLGVPAATVGGTGTPWHTRGYAPDLNKYLFATTDEVLNAGHTRSVVKVTSGPPHKGVARGQARQAMPGAPYFEGGPDS